MCWRSTSRNLHTGRTCIPHQAMVNQALAKFETSLGGSRSVLFLRPAERLCYYKHKRSQRPSGYVTVGKQAEEASR